MLPAIRRALTSGILPSDIKLSGLFDSTNYPQSIFLYSDSITDPAKAKIAMIQGIASQMGGSTDAIGHKVTALQPEKWRERTLVRFYPDIPSNGIKAVITEDGYVMGLGELRTLKDMIEAAFKTATMVDVNEYDKLITPGYQAAQTYIRAHGRNSRD
jgi:hypothetical protein